MPTQAAFRVALAVSAVCLAGCGATSLPAAAPAPADSAHPADVAFVQGMIAHHAQALEMTTLADQRTGNPGIARLAERIRASQTAEIGRMQRWLETRGRPVASNETPEPHAPGHHPLMPGMLSADELRRLAAAEGAEFDRLFLAYMIRHHEGALTMVADLFATEAAGQEPELFRLASEVDADQRAEIARMQRLLTTLDQRSP